jgi:hypothetical protein
MADPGHDGIPLRFIVCGIIDQNAVDERNGKVAPVVPDLVALEARNDEEIGPDPLVDEA